MRRLWTTFWQLSKTERSGYVLLLALMAAYMGLSWWVPTTHGPEYTVLQPPAASPNDSLSSVTVAGTQADLFPFDINTIDAQGLRQLGLRDRSIEGLLRFRSKGGKVRNLTDFDKLFSLSPDEKDRLRPWLLLPKESAADSLVLAAETRTERHESKSKVFQQVDINSADSLALLELPGIGPAFAGRIVRYRERLGGFVRLEQLAEVYGVDSVRYAALAPLIKTNGLVLQQINLLTAAEADLANHPYIGKVLARRLVAFREQRKGRLSCTDLSLIHGLDAQRLTKLQPYLACEGLQQAD